MSVTLKDIKAFCNVKNQSPQIVAIGLAFLLLFSLVDEDIALNTTQTDLADKSWQSVEKYFKNAPKVL